MRRLVQALLALALLATASPAAEPQHLVLGVQASGTVKWELAAISALGLDTANGLSLEVRELADSKAGQIALQARQVDVILSDFVWVSLQRDQGNLVTLVPHSLAVGGLMVDPAAGIASIADLKGKVLAVSGSPVDKSYVILAAAYAKLTGGTLSTDATARFGAPPLVNELLTGGQAQAALNLWNWNARAALAGKVELTSIPSLLDDLGVTETPPLLGWTFFEDTAAQKPEAIGAFLDTSFAAKAALLTDDALWDTIRPAMNVGDDDALFRALRDGYRAGIVAQFDPDNTVAASATFALLVQYGGADVVGDATALSPGTFWPGYRK